VIAKTGFSPLTDSVTRKLRTIAAAIAVAVSIVAHARGAAAGGAKPSVVIVAEGPDADTGRETADAALGDDRVLVALPAWRRALEQQGVHSPLTRELRDTKTVQRTLDRLRRAGNAVHADAVLVILTNRVSGKHNAVLYALDPTSEGPVTGVHVRLGGDNHELARAIENALAELAPLSEPPPPPPERASDAPPVVTPAPTATATPAGADTPVSARPSNHRVGEELFQLSAGIEVGERRFEYTDGLTPNLRTYQLNAAPLVFAGGEVYPLGGSHPLEPAIVLGYARAFALSSSYTSGGTLSTQWSRFYAGGKVRLRTGEAGSPILSLTGAYGEEAFSIYELQSASMPGVDYRFVRAGADARLPLGQSAALFADAAYLFVMSSGQVGARFPRSSVGGVLAELGGALTFATSFEARVTLSYRRFFYAMHPRPGDAYVAGGALDEFSGALASLAYVY
jgi:hypothetical protein